MEVATASNISDEHRIIIRSYAQLCRDLGTLVTKVTEVKQQAPEELFFKVAKKNSHDELESVVEDIGFSDTLGKYNASAFCEEIKRQAAKIDFGDFEPKFEYGFDRKTPHVGGSITTNLQDISNPALSLGIHIQGRQYRRVLSYDRYKVFSIKEGKDTEGLKSFIEQTDSWNWMFGSEYADKFLHKTDCQGGFFKGTDKIPTKQQKSKLLCSYAPRYIYQYTNIGETPGIPIDKVVEAVIADLRYAAQLLSDRNYLARFEKYSPISL